LRRPVEITADCGPSLQVQRLTSIQEKRTFNIKHIFLAQRMVGKSPLYPMLRSARMAAIMRATKNLQQPSRF
jgi:hypothetical protein